MLDIRLFGVFEAELGARRLPPPRRRSTARLLAYLAWHVGRDLPRRQVAEALWPDHAAPAARAELRRNLHALTAHLAATTARDDWIAAGRGVLRLRAATARVDAADFMRACRAALGAGGGLDGDARAALAPAVAAYRADLLVDWDDEWVEAPRRRARERLTDALTALVAADEARGAGPSALAHARRLVALDPLHEATHRAIMRLHAGAGDRAAALAQYARCAALLRDELDVEPSPATARLARAIRADALDAEAPARRDAAVGPHARPASPGAPAERAPRADRPRFGGAFVGRAAELAALARIVPDTPLVTVVGPGGVGKSRLVDAVVARLATGADAPWAGVTWRDLEDDPPAGGARAAGPGPGPGAGGDLAAALDPGDDRPRLLVLDTCEGHLEALAPAVEALVARRGALRILATSRARLGAAGETVMALAPLPGSRDGESAEDAVRLFVARARASGATWRGTDAELDAAATICEALDGLPLAIELAAGRLAHLSLDELGDLVARDVAALGPGPRSAPARQRSLAASYAHDRARLGPEATRALGRLATLAGPFSRDLAARILEPDGGDAPAAAAMLLRLVDAGVVLVRPAPAARDAPYRVPRTLAALARADAERRGEGAALAAEHAAVIVALAEREAAALSTPEAAAGERRLVDLRDDVERAMSWAVAAGDTALGVRFAAALMRFWYRRGVPGRADGWLAALLAAPDLESAAGPRHVALLACCAGVCAHARGDPRGALAHFDGAAARFAALGDARGVAEARCYAALALLALGEGAAARARCVAALDDLEGLDAPVDAAVARSVLAEIALREGDRAAAETLFARALVVLRTARWHALALGNVLRGLGGLALDAGQIDDAAAYFKEGLALFEALDHDVACAVWHGELGCLEYERGEVGAARARFQEALRRHQACGNAAGAALQMHNLGEIALIEGDGALARLLLARSLEMAGPAGPGRDARTARTLCFLAEAYVQLGQPFHARRQLDACAPLAAARRDPTLEAHRRGVGGLLEVVAGRPAAAAPELAAALALWRAAGDDARGLRFADLALWCVARAADPAAARRLATAMEGARAAAPPRSPLEARLAAEARERVARLGAGRKAVAAHAPASVGAALAAAEAALAAVAFDAPAAPALKEARPIAD